MLVLVMMAMRFPFARANEFKIEAKSAILVSLDSDLILYEQNKDERLNIASVTKIMTMLLVYEALDEKIINNTDIMNASAYAVSMGGTQIYLKENEAMSFNDLFKSMVIASANDASVVLAEACHGTVENFVSKMNEKAMALGCKNTLFSDVTGLSDENHYSSAYDLSLIAKELLRKYPQVLEITNVYDDYVRKDSSNPFWLVNTNKLIGRNLGVDGLKTGWTTKSGYCLVATKSKNDMRLISVVLGSPKATIRNDETLKLLNHGHSLYEKTSIVQKGDIFKEEISILYSPSNFYYVASEDYSIIDLKNKKIKYDTEIIIKDKTYYLIIKIDDEVVKEMELITNVVVKKANFIELILRLFCLAI